MVITQQEITNTRIKSSAPMSLGEILRDLIREYMASPEYQRAVEGERYYHILHDIYKYDFRTEMIADTRTMNDGTEAEVWNQFTNMSRSNFKAANSFFHEQVAQKSAYILGKEPSISVVGYEENAELAAYRDALTKTTGNEFTKRFKRLVLKASTGGKAWLHEYKDADGALKQQVVGRLEGLPIYDTAYEDNLKEFVHFYKVQVRTGRTEKKERTCAEWWTPFGVTYWYADDDGAFMPDPERRGIQPHYETVTLHSGADGVTMVETGREGKVFERFPWIELANNEDSMTDLEPVKDLIDMYDLIQSKGTNNLMDFNEFWAIIQGFGGDTASSIVRKLFINHAVSIGSPVSGGNVELKQLALDMQGRIDWLKILRDAIYEFGMAVDVKGAENLGSAPSGTSLKFQYSLLDLKASAMITELCPAIQAHFWFVTQEINKRDKTDYDASLVEVSCNKTMILNDAETVNMIVASENIVPERVLLAAHPLVSDPDAAAKEMNQQRKKRATEAARAFGKPEEEGEEDET